MNEPFVKVYLSLVTSDELSPGELRTLIYLELKGHANIFYGSLKNVAKELDLTPRTVIKHVSCLKRNGFILVNHRPGKTSEITFTPKAFPMKNTSLGGEEKFTQIDKINKDSLFEYLTRGEYLASDFEQLSSIKANGDFETWSCFYANLLRKDYTLGQLMDVNEYISNSDFWKNKVHSPLMLADKNKHGVAWVDIWIRESNNKSTK